MSIFFAVATETANKFKKTKGNTMKQILKNIVKVLFFPLLVIRAVWQSKLTLSIFICLFTAGFACCCGWSLWLICVNFGVLFFSVYLFIGMICTYILFKMIINEIDGQADAFFAVNCCILAIVIWPIFAAVAIASILYCLLTALYCWAYDKKLP